MNIAFDINQVSIQNVYILDQKKNIIMDGQFTKIIYSNEWFTMNGIYLLFPIDNFINELVLGKNSIRFQPYTKSNLSLIQRVSLFETDILELYKKNTHCLKKISNIVARQMYSGTMKITKEYYIENNQPMKHNDHIEHNEQNNSTGKYMIKISGVWENNDEIGLTYKLIEYGN